MPTMTEVLDKLGVLPETTVKELARWPGGQLPPATYGEPAAAASGEEAVAAIRDVIEGEGQVELRETDPDLLRRYATSKRSGKLLLVIKDTRGNEVERSSFKIEFGQTSLGEYIIPWASESIAEYMLDPDTYLLVNSKKIKFINVREAYYGPEKVFMVATPEVKDVDR